MLGHYELLSENINSQRGTQPTSHDWIGLYKNLEDELPEWVVQATLRTLSMAQFNSMRISWVPSLNHRLNQMQGMRTNPQLSHVKCHMLGWTNYYEVVLIPNSPCSLVHWNNSSSTMHSDGGRGYSFPSIFGQAWKKVDYYSRGS